MAVAALLGHARLLAAMRRRPPLLLAPTLIVAAGVVASGGTESVYFGVVVVCVGVPVTVVRPGYALACGLLASAFELAGGLLSARGVEWPTWTSNSAALLAAAAAGSAGVWMFGRSVRDIPAVLAASDHAAERPPLVPALPPAPSRTAGLSPREREVLAPMVAGRTPAQAALELGIQLSTVRRHLRHAKRRTGARTLTELVVIAAEELA